MTDARTAQAELEHLALYLMQRFPAEMGRGRRNESAVDMAIRLLQELEPRPDEQDAKSETHRIARKRGMEILDAAFTEVLPTFDVGSDAPAKAADRMLAELVAKLRSLAE